MAHPSLRKLRLAALVLFCVGATWAKAEANSPLADSPLLPGGGFSWWAYGRAIGVLFLVLAALWAALWLLKRSGRFAGMPRPGSLPRDGLYLEGYLNLGPRKGISVVRFLNKRLLLGITEHQITLLTETYPNDAPSTSDAAAFQRCLDNTDQSGGQAVSASPEPERD